MGKACWICGGIMSEDVAKKFGTPMKELGLSRRVQNCLNRRDIKNLEELVKLNLNDIWIRGLGSVGIAEINKKLKALGYDGWED